MQAADGGLGAAATLADAEALALPTVTAEDEGGAASCERTLVGVVGPCGGGAFPSHATETASGEPATRIQTPPRSSDAAFTAMEKACAAPTRQANFTRDRAISSRSRAACL
jgi:hypothetical protein